VGRLVKLDDEPNGGVATANLLGEGITTWPAGDLPGNLNPFTDTDFFYWGMPLVTTDGVQKPRARLKNTAPVPLLVCAAATCGQTATALAAPLLECDEDETPFTSDKVLGCCVEVAAGDTDGVSVAATCPNGGTIQQGFGYAIVKLPGNVPAGVEPRCGDYELTWGAD
jgi:hypothetical protein